MKTHNLINKTITTIAVTLCFGAMAESRDHVKNKSGQKQLNVNTDRKTIQKKSEGLQTTQETDVFTSAEGIQVQEGPNSMTLRVGANGVQETFQGKWRLPTPEELNDLRSDSGLRAQDINTNLSQIKVFEPDSAGGIKEGALFRQKDSKHYLRPSNDTTREGIEKSITKIFADGGKVLGGGGGDGAEEAAPAGDQVAAAAQADGEDERKK